MAAPRGDREGLLVQESLAPQREVSDRAGL